MIEGLTPVVVDSYGGLVTSVDRGDLPNGLAARAVDVEFFPGGVQSRGPFENYISSATGTLGASPVRSILSFPRNDGTRHRLFLLANGTLQDEYPEGTVTTVATDLGPNLIMRGCVLNNRAFMAFSDGKTPAGRPMWWDGQWFDPLGQEGPSVSPSMAGNVAAAGNATASGALMRQMMMLYETRGGFLTLPSSSATVGAVLANDQYRFISMPTPPYNVSRTRIAATADLGSDFYTPASMVQSPAASGTFLVPYSSGRPGFSDTDIRNGQLLTHDRLNNWPLPPCLGIESYNNRLVAWGALNNIPKLLLSSQGSLAVPPTLTLNYTAGLKNGSFTGGRDATGYPSGWIGGSGAAGGDLALISGAAGGSWKITGDGATAKRGELTTIYNIERYNDFPSGTDYYVRMRVKRSAGAVHGKLVFEITGSTQSPQPTVLVSELTTDWAWYTKRLLPASDITVNSPHLLIDQDAGSGKLENNEWVAVDEIQIYPATAPNLNGYLLISQPNDLETYDYTRGLYGVNPGDGQAVVNASELRGTLYVFKERSLYGVTDNGSDPYQWPKPALMSDAVGCLSVHGVGRGDGWLVTISESGVYEFSGGQPQKISQEIQKTWARINFTQRHLSWCVADPDAQRIYIAVPMDGATYVNTLLVCDYVSGGLQQEPITSPGNGRKWSTWTPPESPGFTCGSRIDRDDGQRTFVVGGGVDGASGYVSKREPETWGALADTFGASTPSIMATYETATIGQPQERSFFGYVVAKMRGTDGGHVGLTLVRPDDTELPQATRALDTAPLHDLEWQTMDTDTQVGLRFANLSDGVFSMKRCAAYYKKPPFGKVRGRN